MDAVRSAAQKYLNLITGNPLAPSIRLQTLANVLDELQFATTKIPDGSPTFADDEPKLRHKEYVEKIRENFPELGFYPNVFLSGGLEQLVTVGDANDDAADIAKDLSAAMWYWEHFGEESALQHLRYHYKIHWGRHLIDLRSYLYALIYES
ncbi:MAG TPA: DUF5063 domain-containing protein [Rhizomicrobium sp.]|jgi:hypothetical protein|nr:DUF5063 domain-containing protein [Rhizomicrobium sp.]